jgi:ERCC4-related helicase
MPHPTIPAPQPGDIIRVRTRRWLVASVEPVGGFHTVTAHCVDDDAQGDETQVVWEAELDRAILNEEAWRDIGRKGFDDRRHFGAYLDTLRWNCVTATDERLFQSPFRAGIRIEPYQLEPLHKALRLPRVNLFIADDVGLGKTIEAGLIASELLLRRRVHDIVVACPPSMLFQWKDELETRFGLSFEIYDRAFVERVRRERGFATNPWTTFPRFLISHKLLIDEAYVAPMRDWLDNLRPGSLLIFDEAHHAAPASSSKYAIDSQTTKAIRDLAARFEHRLFLSATPHNGHSNSFSALLELLDRERFIRGVSVRPSDVKPVMVRRLKEDLRAIGIPGFPERRVEQIDLPTALGFPELPANTPELRLAELLEQYRQLRIASLQASKKRESDQFLLVYTSLQKRLLSSIEAFSRTLKKHRDSLERSWKNGTAPKATAARLEAPDADDARAELDEEAVLAGHDAEIEKASAHDAPDSADAKSATLALLDQMAEIAQRNRALPDARIEYLVRWIREHCCPGATLPKDGKPVPAAAWTGRRVILFTEWDDTKRYLEQQIRTAICGTDDWERRVEIFHGPTPPEKKEQLKQAFNLPPDEHPVRILICTDAAREGLNLQAHCHDLFHFDVPWNPARMEQRNGRIDRKLQPQPVVFCRYFYYTQRPEDRVLRALVRKQGKIREELGTFSKVLSNRLAAKLDHGIQRSAVGDLETDIEEMKAAQPEIIEEEIETIRERERLKAEIAAMSARLEDARKAIQFDPERLRDALGCSLELLGARPLEEAHPGRFTFPDLQERRGADPAWSAVLDSLRMPPTEGRRDAQWRRASPIRPVVFHAQDSLNEGTVQLHLSHQIVQRLLGRFTAQGFVHHDLSRACVAQSEDDIPRVALLARLSVYGPNASRLHEELLTVTAEWSPLARRKTPLKPYGSRNESRTLELLQKGLSPAAPGVPTEIATQLAEALPTDIEQLLSFLQPQGQQRLDDVVDLLRERGEKEASAMDKILSDQRKRVLGELEKYQTDSQQLTLSGFSEAEERQKKADAAYWKKWLENVEGDLRREPDRIRAFYQMKSHRIEPVGIAYLWPVKHSAL